MSAAFAYCDWHDSMDGLKELIQGWKTRTGKTQSDLALLVGASEKTVSRWKRGERVPSPKYRPKLAETLGIEPSQLAEIITAAQEAGAQEDDDTSGRLERRGIRADKEHVFLVEWSNEVAQDSSLSPTVRSVLQWLPNFLGPRGGRDIFVTQHDLLKHADVTSADIDDVWSDILGSGYLTQIDRAGRVFVLSKRSK